MNTFCINGNVNFQAAEIGRLIIYGNGVKLFESDRGMEPQKIIDGKLSSIWSERINKVILSGDIKNARKENLNRTDNYYLKYKVDYLWENRIALYVHVSEIAVDYIGEMIAMQSKDETCYLRTYRLVFNRAEIMHMYAEKIPCNGNWTLPENGRWSDCYGTEEKPCFDTYDNSKSPLAKKRGLDPNEKGVIKRWKTFETVDNYAAIVTAPYYSKIEYSAERQRKNALADAINNSGLFSNYSFSHYDIEKLEKVLNISLKEEE